MLNEKNKTNLENRKREDRVIVFQKLIRNSFFHRTVSTRDLILRVLIEGSLTFSQIARMLGVSRLSVQLIANQLVEDGLCLIRINDRDLRSPLLFLTEKGQKRIGQNLKNFEYGFSGAILCGA